MLQKVLVNVLRIVSRLWDVIHLPMQHSQVCVLSIQAVERLVRLGTSLEQLRTQEHVTQVIQCTNLSFIEQYHKFDSFPICRIWLFLRCSY